MTTPVFVTGTAYCGGLTFPVSAQITVPVQVTPVPYVLPGSVGYLGDIGALTPYSPPGSGFPGAGNVPPGSGGTWHVFGLQIPAANLVLDHVIIYGNIYFTGQNSAMTNSVIQAGTQQEFTPFQIRGAVPGTVTFTNCTLGWLPGKGPFDIRTTTGTIWSTNSSTLLVDHCALSGSPVGVGPIVGPNSQVTYCTISVAEDNPTTSSGGPNHLCGISNFGVPNVLIRGCYIDASTGNTPYATAALFWQSQSGGTIPGCVVDGNYLKGGALVLHNEDAVGLVVTNNVFTGGFYGDAASTPPGTIGTWTGNVHPDGSPVPNPQPH